MIPRVYPCSDEASGQKSGLGLGLSPEPKKTWVVSSVGHWIALMLLGEEPGFLPEAAKRAVGRNRAAPEREKKDGEDCSGGYLIGGFM